MEKSATTSGTGGMRKAHKRGSNLLGFQTGFTGLTVFFACLPEATRQTAIACGEECPSAPGEILWDIGC